MQGGRGKDFKDMSWKILKHLLLCRVERMTFIVNFFQIPDKLHTNYEKFFHSLKLHILFNN